MKAFARFVLVVGLAVLALLALNLAPPVRAPGPGVDYIIIQRDPSANGTWVANGTYLIGDNDTFYSVGYNTTSGYIGPVHAYWWSDNLNSGSVNPKVNVSSTTFTAGPQPGTLHVHVYCARNPAYGGCNNNNNGTQGYVANTTGPLTVLQAPIASIVIRDAPNGGGNVVLDRTYYQGDTDVFYAAGYDANGSYAGEAYATWNVNTTACKVTTPGTSTTFTGLLAGKCIVTATYNTVSNQTGNLTILARPTVYVDDDGVCGGNTPCYTTFNAAIENTTDGSLVIVYPGTYPEHVLVNKEVRILGLNRYTIFVDGGGDGIVFLVTANNVELSNMTIQEGKYDIYVDQANDTKIVYNLIRNYSYGIYFNRTHDAFTAWNLITTGQYGVVTDHVHNDAVRWNTIAWNTVYGAKDYDSSLRNCFNWNQFHDNHIAYWYDPNEPLAPFEFDGNVLWNNDIGVQVTNGPALRLTNNTFRNNGRALLIEGSDLNVSANRFQDNFIAVEVVGAAGNVTANTFTGNTFAVMCTDASTTISANTVTGGAVGVLCSGFTGRLAGNDIVADGGVAVRLDGANGAAMTGNIVHGGAVTILRSMLRELAVSDGVVSATDSTFMSLDLGGTSSLSESWTVQVTTVLNSGPVRDAHVFAYDRDDRLAATETTDADGRATLTLLQRTRTHSSAMEYGPYTLRATSGEAAGTITVAANAPVAVTLPLTTAIVPVAFPWLLVLGSVLLIGIGGGLLGLEPIKVALLAMAVPLFSRIGKHEVLDDYTRGRVYQYLEMNPGDHFNSICRALELGAGTVTYHLGVLERTGLVSARTDHVYKRFYPKGVPPPETNGGTLSEVQIRITHAVRDLPGITQKELARMMGLRASTVNYQIGRLAERGLVREERRGRHVQYFPAAGPANNA